MHQKLKICSLIFKAVIVLVPKNQNKLTAFIIILIDANVCKRGRKQGTRVCRLCKRTFTSTDEYHMHLQEFHRNNMLFNTAVETASFVNESLSSTENESNSAQSVI